ncbi:WD40-repeat-containing domain protein [Halteromyces radiatus]|uniref:WD40-repeat-containing domain protein n=1 Tax=Halteromyces radiatus TaxID=101107 RepID=UPI00221FE0D0|nr:WD40-repeat-containing domain protein [Halteromyces radiatus]KAI8079998.1 WD40-repeat-containing domain protein [Halteromyces radiatus]
MSTEQEQIQIRLITKQKQYAVKDAPILVPAAFKRYGLSEIVNSLLDLDKPIPFEFLIDGEILRTSIAEYLTEQQLSTENVITIEYIESMLPPTPLTSYQHDDWISSVQGYDSLFLTGSYDNMVRLWNTSGECTHTLIGHTEAVKSVAFGSVTASSTTLFSAGLDHIALAWQINEDGDEEVLYECRGHQAAIESLAVHPQKSYFATASADATIRVWSTEKPMEDEVVSQETPAKKKKRTETKNRLTKAQSVTLSGHVGPVNAIDYDTADGNVIYSGGWDHSIRSWDVEQQVNTMTKVNHIYIYI